MRIILEEGDNCPVCSERLELYEAQSEDTEVFLICPKDQNHYKRYMGLFDDLYE